jgi:hypothetical protein
MLGRTSVIPHSYADQKIKFRSPWTQGAELLVKANQSGIFFPDAVFQHNIDKPGEFERMYVRLTALNEQQQVIFPQPAETDLQKVIRLAVEDMSKNQNLTKNVTLAETIISSVEGDKGSWEWYVPYTLVRSEGFTVAVDSLNFPAGVEFIRVAISFQGSLTVIQPASETR